MSYARNPERNDERRTNQRFPLRLAVTYRKLSARVPATPVAPGIGETVNIGSKGLEFTTSEPLETGDLVRVSVEWPVRLDQRISLTLVAEGRILRGGNGRAIMNIGAYEFRTRAEAHAAPGSETESAEGKKCAYADDKTTRLAC